VGKSSVKHYRQDHGWAMKVRTSGKSGVGDGLLGLMREASGWGGGEVQIVDEPDMAARGEARDLELAGPRPVGPRLMSTRAASQDR
jgi:hypothetical protein